MADLTLRLRVDPVTGRREIVIDYTSDSDALPMEHEEQHRELAEKVVDGGFKNKKVEVSRAAEGGVAESPGPEPSAEPATEPTLNKT